MFAGHTDLVRTVKYDGRRIVSGSYDGRISCWYVDTDEPGFAIRHPNASKVFRVQFDATMILACFQDGTVATFDFGSGLSIAPLLGKV